MCSVYTSCVESLYTMCKRSIFCLTLYIVIFYNFMISHRRASRNRKRKHKELEEKERTKEKKELENEAEEGQPKTKKKKRKMSKIRKRRWRTKETKEPKLNTGAHKKNIIEEEERQDREAKDEGEEALNFKRVQEEG